MNDNLKCETTKVNDSKGKVVPILITEITATKT